MRLSRSILIAGSLMLSAAAQQTRPAIPTAAPSAVDAKTPTMQTGYTPTSISSDTYLIGPGDLLQLNVWKEPNFSVQSIPVRPDGQISLSLMGDLSVVGLTPMSLSKDIAERLKKYVNDPLVTVTVIGVAPKEVYFLGEIGKTGALTLTPGMTPLQAIAAAGGLSPYAKKKLYILRKGSSGQQKISFDYKKAVKTGDQQGVALQPGDTIIVP